MLSKQLKSRIFDYLIRSLYTTGLSSQSLGHLLRAFHISMPFICFLCLLNGNYTVTLGCILFIISSVLAFIVFNGCFLTRLEYMLLQDTFTVVDPMLEFFGLPITKEGRYYITWIMGGLYSVLYSFIFYSTHFTQSYDIQL